MGEERVGNGGGRVEGERKSEREGDGESRGEEEE